MFLGRLSIRMKLAVLMLLPLVSLLLLGGVVLRDRHVASADMERVGALTRLSVLAGDLLHHTQRERGLSAMFMGAGERGADRAALDAERRATDQAASALREAFEALDAGQADAGVTREYGEVASALGELDARRAGVDGRAVESAAVVAAYTDLNRRLLALVTELGRASSSIDIAARSTAYVGLMRAKEAAGVERAVLANAFAAGRFAPGMYAQLLQLLALQDEALARFRVYGGEAVRAKYDDALAGPFAAETARLREAALASGGGEVVGVDAQVWFQRQTQKIDAMREVETFAAADIAAAAATLEREARAAFAVALAGMAGVVALTLLVGWRVALSIVRPLGSAVEVLGAVAEGDFTRRLDVDTRDEVGRMAASLNRATASMRTALAEVRDVASGLAQASEELSQSSQQIAGGAQEQAASLEETAASLQEIAATVRGNSDNASAAEQLSTQARDVAESGGGIVSRAVEAMDDIRGASGRIAEIIGTIDEIAFQTNLLALNAAVEAAQAGDHGRGFAVVATEVRNLAGRSGEAARQVRALIEDALGKVDAGAGLVDRSGQALEEIVTSSRRVRDLIAEIAVASREQARGVDQVNQAVEQMDQVTQGSSAQTEELSSTAESLASQAEQLRALVERFRLDEGERVDGRPSGPVPHRRAAARATRPHGVVGPFHVPGNDYLHRVATDAGVS